MSSAVPCLPMLSPAIVATDDLVSTVDENLRWFERFEEQTAPTATHDYDSSPTLAGPIHINRHYEDEVMCSNPTVPQLDAIADDLDILGRSIQAETTMA
jgi:hypothetical protein